MRLALAFVLCTMPFAAFAAGSDDNEPPTQTNTTKTCTDGKVWDEKTQSCQDAKSGLLDDDTLFKAAREFAYAGQPQNALNALAAMKEGESDRVLTYLGFANRKAGNLEIGLGYYDKALERNPDNLLARSYYGQALVEMGEMQLAQAQLDAIIARGGEGGWPATSLAEAIRTGQTTNY